MLLTPYQLGNAKDFSPVPSRFNPENRFVPDRRGSRIHGDRIDTRLLMSLVFEQGDTLASTLIYQGTAELIEIEWVSSVYGLLEFRWRQDGVESRDIIGVDVEKIRSRYLELTG